MNPDPVRVPVSAGSDDGHEPDVREPEPSEIERQIETLRMELSELVGELDRRRRELLDVRLQLRRNPGVAALVASSVAAVAIGAVMIARRRRRRARSLGARVGNLAHALALLSEQSPERVERSLRGRSQTPGSDAIAKLIALAASRGLGHG